MASVECKVATISCNLSSLPKEQQESIAGEKAAAYSIWNAPDRKEHGYELVQRHYRL